MANASTTQSFYNIVDGKFDWHFEPPILEELRGDIAATEYMIHYYEEAKRFVDLEEEKVVLESLLLRFDAETTAWKESQ